MAIKMLKIDDLVSHKLLQAPDRGPEKEDGIAHVEDLRLAIKKKVKLPRPKVADIEGLGFCPWDGHHTIDAYEKEGVKEIECEVSKMTLEEARMKAATEANRGHTALKRSRKTKEWAVKTALELNPKWSDGKIARETGTSENLVARVRKENPAMNPSGPRLGADGKVRNNPSRGAKREPAKPDAQKLFDFKGADERFNWLARGIDALKEHTDDAANRKKALAGLNGAKKIVERWQKQMQKKLEDDAEAAAKKKIDDEKAAAAAKAEEKKEKESKKTA